MFYPSSAYIYQVAKYSLIYISELTPAVKLSLKAKPSAVKHHLGKKGIWEYEEALADLSNPRIWPGMETDHWAYVVARYPENQNSLLSRTIQKQLGECKYFIIKHYSHY